MGDLSGHLSSSVVDGYWAGDLWLARCFNFAGDGFFQSAFDSGPMNEVQSILMTTGGFHF